MSPDGGRAPVRGNLGAGQPLTNRKSIKLGDLVEKFGGELIGNPDVRIEQVATLESARSGELAFLAQSKYLPELKRTHAAAVVVGPDARNATDLPQIVSANPYAYFARVSAFLNPPPPVEAGVHASAVVNASARVAPSAAIGPCAVIGRDARIGENTEIGPGCAIGEGAIVGAGTRLHANVTVYHDCSIGERCELHSGVVIGSDGFGGVWEDGMWRKLPQIGRVTIGNDVEIGANTTIDRGALDDTVIEDGVKLDNQIQIAHNVRIGAHTAIAACVGIAGSAKIGRRCTLGGASMIYGHITIADGVTVSAGTLIMKSLDQPGTYTGVYPFSKHQRWLKTAAHLRQLDQLVERVRELETKSRKPLGDET